MARSGQKITTAEEVIARIDRRIADRRLLGMKHSDRAISLMATGSADTLRSIRRGISENTQTGISTETLKKLAGPLATTVEWLLTGRGVEDVDALPTDRPHVESDHVFEQRDPSKKMVRLVGYVGAGSEAHYYALADDDYEYVEAPDGASDQTVAAEIRGKSFGPLMDGWLVYYDDVRSPVTPDLFGEICVVGLDDDRILIKQVMPQRDGRFTLLSNSNDEPIRDAEIEWAARVTDMKRRRK